MTTSSSPSTGPCNTIGGFGRSRTAINHPLTNGNPGAILVVTPNGSNSSTGQLVYVDPVAVYYAVNAAGGNCVAGRWMIYSPSHSTAMVAGQLFNVFVINP